MRVCSGVRSCASFELLYTLSVWSLNTLFGSGARQSSAWPIGFDAVRRNHVARELRWPVERVGDDVAASARPTPNCRPACSVALPENVCEKSPVRSSSVGRFVRLMVVGRTSCVNSCDTKK